MPPTSSVAALAPPGTSTVSTESTGTLAKRIGARGLCAPVWAALAVTGDNDPWFPVDDEGKVIESGDKAVKAARRACSGCPVIAECLELAWREESVTGDVNGIRGALAADERRAAYRAASIRGRAAR